MIARPIEQTPANGEATPERWLYVPVDGSESSLKALDMAVTLAARRSCGVVLLGVVPEAMAAPVGAWSSDRFHPAFGPAVMDSEALMTMTLRQVLFPLRRELEAASIPARLRLLHGHAPASRLWEIIKDDPGDRALVLADPRTLDVALRELTVRLLVQPPCNVYLAGPETGPQRPRFRVLSTLVRRALRLSAG